MTPADRAEIEQYQHERLVLNEELRLAVDPRQRRILRGRIQATNEATNAIWVLLRQRLATERGWIVAKKTFHNLNVLVLPRQNPYNIHPSGYIDHADSFRSPKRPWRPVALLSHSYRDDRDGFEAIARARGIVVEFLEWSWYYPARCLAALFIGHLNEPSSATAVGRSSSMNKEN